MVAAPFPLYSAEILPPEMTEGRFPEIRTAMMLFVGQFLADYERAARRAGLTSAQARVLSFAAYRPSSMKDLAEEFGSDPSNMTSKVTQLTRLGLVEQRVDPDDGRVRLVAATPTGVEVATRLCYGREWVASTLSKLSPEQVEVVSEALTLLMDDSRAGPEAPDIAASRPE